MWAIKLELDAKNLFFGSLAIKHNVALFGCPLSFSFYNKELCIQVNGVIVGKEKNKKEFLKEIKRNKRILALETKNDYVVLSYKTKPIFKWLNNKHLVHSAHLSIDFDGIEYLTIESFKKTPLLFLLKFLKSNYSAKLISIQKIESSVLPILKSNVNLTSKQRYALELALKKGYYKNPRQISIKELAIISKISFSTFQQHLRKAECKIMPII
jgi:predicted DNA binding protein